MCSWLRRAAVDWRSLMFWSGRVMFCNSLWGDGPAWPLLTGDSWLHKHALKLRQKHLALKYSWQMCLFYQAAGKQPWHLTKVKICYFKLKVKWAHRKSVWNFRLEIFDKHSLTLTLQFLGTLTLTLCAILL